LLAEVVVVLVLPAQITEAVVVLVVIARLSQVNQLVEGVR
jgi:hypothetical protein